MPDNQFQPLVSIITPSFQQGRFIEDTLLSVMNQDYPRLEHIVIDGGSEDETILLLKTYQEKYPLIWISEEDRGHADAVNKGFERAAGEVIGWINSDDAYLEPGVISAVMDHFLIHPELDVIYGDIVFMDDKSSLSMVRCVPRNFTYRRLLRGCFISQPAVFLRRKVIDRFQLDPAIQYAVDYEFWLRIAQDFRFGHLDRILAADRYYSGRRMITGAEKLSKETSYLQDRYGREQDPGGKAIARVDRFVSGSLRRGLGLAKLLGIFRKPDFAFPLQLGKRGRAVIRQINPFGGYHHLMGKEVEK